MGSARKLTTWNGSQACSQNKLMVHLRLIPAVQMILIIMHSRLIIKALVQANANHLACASPSLFIVEQTCVTIWWRV